MIDRRLLLGVVITITAALLFCTKSVILKCSFARGADAGQMLALRMAMSLPIFCAIAWYHERRAVQRLSPGERALIAAWGVLGYGLCPWLDFRGLQYIPVSLERMVLFAYPTLVVIFAMLRGSLRLTWVMAVGLLTTYLGVLCTWGDQQLRPGVHGGLGVALVAASALGYAIFLVGSNSALRRFGDQRFMATAISGACLGVAVHALIGQGAHAFVVAPGVYGLAVLLAIPGTVIPAMLTGAGLRLLGPSRFAVVSTIGPLGTVLLAMVVLQERPGVAGWIGILLTLGGGVATGLSRSAAPVPAPVRGAVASLGVVAAQPEPAQR